MKRVLFLTLILISLKGYSMSPGDSLYSGKFFKYFSVYFNMTELGTMIPLKQKKLPELENGLSNYYNQEKKSLIHYGIGGSLYFKNMIGIGIVFTSYEFESHSQHFQNYLATKYSNYLKSNFYLYDFHYKVQGFSLNASYRKRFKYFILEPKFRIMINSIKSVISDFDFYMKEKGSNQYVTFDLSEHRKGYRNSYNLSLSFIYPFRPKNILKLEVGIQMEFFISPMRKTVVFNEKVYGQEPVITTQDVSGLNPALAFTGFINWRFGR